jgi:hypothetical protein
MTNYSQENKKIIKINNHSSLKTQDMIKLEPPLKAQN